MEVTSSNRGRDPVSEDRFRKLVLLSWNAVAVIPRDVEEKLNQLVNEIVKRGKASMYHNP